MPRQKIREGDIFEISLENAEKSFGQVLSLESEALNSVGLALWQSSTLSHSEMIAKTPVAVLLVTPDLLKNGVWRIIDNGAPVVTVSQRPYEGFRSKGWVGAKVVGSGIVVEFIRACAGLRSWNKWANPSYLDELLFTNVARPPRAIESYS
jgi:hypothetical protein